MALICLGVYAFVPGVKPAVDPVLMDQLIIPGGSALYNAIYGLVTGSFWITYVTPSLNSFLIGVGFCAIIVVIVWKKGTSLHWPWSSTPTTTTSSSIASSSTPVGATVRPETPIASTPVVSEPVKEEEETTST